MPPGAELDLVAVDQDQAAITRQGAVGDDEVLGAGLARTGFAADQHVAFGQADVDVVAVFVNAQVDRVKDGQRENPHGCHGWWLLSGVVTGGGQAPERCPGRCPWWLWVARAY